MKTSTNPEQQLALRLDREAKQHWDEIIRRIEYMARNFEIGKIDAKSPFRNVLNVAIEPNTSLEVVKNFIRYQVGRQGSSDIWKTTKSKQLFADAVVIQIDDLLELSQKTVEAIANNIDKRLKELKQELNGETGEENSPDTQELKEGLQGKNQEKDSLCNQEKFEKLKKELQGKSREGDSLLDLREYLDENRLTLIQSQHLKLTQLYLGYLSREHTALSEEEKIRKKR